MESYKKSALWAKSDGGFVKNKLLGHCGIPKVAQSDGVLVKNGLLGRFGVPKVAKSDGELLPNELLGILNRILRIPWKRCQELLLGPPCTRAGGQDDMSYTNSLKLRAL